MTANELIEQLQSLDEETKKKTVALYIKDKGFAELTNVKYVPFTDYVQLSKY